MPFNSLVSREQITGFAGYTLIVGVMGVFSRRVLSETVLEAMDLK